MTGRFGSQAIRSDTLKPQASLKHRIEVRPKTREWKVWSFSNEGTSEVFEKNFPFSYVFFWLTLRQQIAYSDFDNI